ncbi:MAG: FAD-dependent oxidoreductase, partial [Tepidisphaeraceae bacterium]
MPGDFDIIIIGGGHAGAEAAWAASHLGCKTALITMDPTRIGQMSCNPAIGGLAKGQMVREIDALGGLMGIATDNTGIQFRMLNRSKGPAVWGPRAQADKHRYAKEVQRLLQTCPNLTIVPGEVADIKTDSHSIIPPSSPVLGSTELAAGSPQSSALSITGLSLANGQHLPCRAVIVTTGTFLRGLMHTGEKKTEGGRIGEAAAKGLSSCLARLGLEMGRLKTGTPPRLDKPTIDFAAFTPQPGDERPAPFSYLNESGREWKPPLPQVHCWIGATNETMHQIIRANLHRAPMYSGQITSTGPRYGPSIEDKVVRFADKSSHHIFLEPEGLDTDEI